MFKRKLGHARKYNNALDMSLGKTNLINLEPILVLFICVNLHKSVIRNTKNLIKMLEVSILYNSLCDTSPTTLILKKNC